MCLHLPVRHLSTKALGYFLVSRLSPAAGVLHTNVPPPPRGTQSPTKKEKECQRIFPEEAPAGETSETKIFCNSDLLPWEICSLEYCKNGHRQPSALEFPAYRFNQVWIEKIGLKRNWGWSGNAWAIWWDRMAINVLKRSGLRLRVSGSRFNEYWSKRIWREQAPLFLFSHVTGFLRRCKQTTHQQPTKERHHLNPPWWTNAFVSALLTGVKVRGFLWEQMWLKGSSCMTKAHPGVESWQRSTLHSLQPPHKLLPGSLPRLRLLPF